MLLPFFQWMQSLKVSAYFLETTWASPIIQCLHLLALVVFAGAILVVDIRLLGRGLVQVPVAKLVRSVEPWLIWAFVALAATGIPQLTSTALKQYYSPFFWWKMELLTVGIVFTFTIRRKIALANEDRIGWWWPKLVGVVSIAIWTAVASWARLIGLLS